MTAHPFVRAARAAHAACHPQGSEFGEWLQMSGMLPGEQLQFKAEGGEVLLRRGPMVPEVSGGRGGTACTACTARRWRSCYHLAGGKGG